MEIYNLDGKRREYIRPTWLSGRGWDRLVCLLTLCRSEKDMDEVLELAAEYIASSGDENLDKMTVQFSVQFGKLSWTVYDRLRF